MVKIGVDNVDDKVWLEFKSYVLRKHKILRGKLGKELTKALETFLRQAK